MTMASSAFAAELWSVLLGPRLAWNLGATQLISETDSKSVA